MAPTMKHPAEYKRLIVCCDGTWQASDKGPRTVPSNVTKFARALRTAELRQDSKKIQQVVYYQAGVATGTHLSFDYTGNLGIGLDANVISTYYFLSNNYHPGDEIFLFGFSRGAYTVRCVAALVSRFGIIEKRNMDRFPVIYDAYRLRKSEEDFDAAFRGMEHLFPIRYEAKITVIGCWDTVGAMGLPEFWWVEKLGLNNSHKFRSVELSESWARFYIENAFHAIALDEHRSMFTPTLWHLPKRTSDGRPMPNLVQCWFPGVHINSGGGSTKNLLTMLSTECGFEGNAPAVFNKETDMEELADITFGWMVDKCRPFLSFNSKYLAHIVTRHETYLRARSHPDPAPGYAAGPVKDPYIPYIGYLIGGSTPRTPRQYDNRNKNRDPNYVAEGTNEYFHPSVRARWEALGEKWTPSPIQGWSGHWVPKARNTKQSGWIWVKKLPNGKNIRVPECRLGGDMEESMERMLMKEEQSLKRLWEG
ncbi:hypothetical protein FRB97_008341 [Tulasnella sp. 331]|nr:hypothetical protein FRB97_008341 [Tulasnella sp. 331]KAG8887523.1 hypothetical protein FRB98_009486 [Tulasnella sp. 332]